MATRFPAETPQASQPLIVAVRGALRAAAEPAKAPGMQRYMKSEMPYLGVSSQPLRTAMRDVFSSHELESCEVWRDTVLALWREATHREERYAALELAGWKAYRDHRTRRDALLLYEELVVTGAWWDYVDGIASHRVGELLVAHPKWTAHRMRQWSRAPDLWKRRTSMLCQLRRKETTDLDLLYECFEPSLEDPEFANEFFIRKAIGWALRTYAWTDPDEVVRYVAANAERLSGLTKREALKNVLKSGRIEAIP
jgi:3-methyladenine DNA glycosylase AlkD